MAAQTKVTFAAKLSTLATNLLVVLPTSVTPILIDGTSFVPSVLQRNLLQALSLFQAVDSAKSLLREG